LKRKSTINLCLQFVFAVAFLLLQVGSGYSQNAFLNTFGNGDGSDANAVILTSDGGYAVTGWYDVQGAFTEECYLIKTDEFGDTIWTRTFGETLDSNANGRDGSGNKAYDLVQTFDGGYFMVDEANGFGVPASDVYVVRLDANAEIMWSRTFGGIESDHAQSVLQLPDSGFVIGGYTESYGAGIRDIYLLRIDKNGELEWSKTIGGTSLESATEIKATADGGFVAVGYSFSFGAISAEVYLLKMTSAGSIEWERTYGGPMNDYGYSVRQCTDGGYVVGGSTGSFGAGLDDMLILKTDANGILEWAKTYGGDQREVGYGIEQTADLGFIVGGYTRSFGAGEDDIYLIKTDSIGDTLWTRTFGSVDDDFCRSMKLTPEGGVVLAGHTYGFDVGGSDVFLVKTDDDGMTDCHWYNTATISEDVSFTSNSVSSTIGTGAKIAHPESISGFTASDVGNACDFKVGVKDIDQQGEILVYPNPANSILNIQLSAYLLDPVAYEILDIQGRVVTSGFITNGAEQVNLIPFSQGLYVLKLKSHSGLEIRRFIKL
jgi:hypothetical protein